MKYQLEVSNITKSYGDLKANDNVSLRIKDSSIHALLGENGAGKSTLVKIIYGSLSPDSGEMKWANNEYSPKSHFQARENGIAMVFQHFSLFESLTVEENMRVIHSLTGSKSKINYSTILKKIGMSGMNKIFTYNMSAGQKRRLGLTRLFMTKSKLWFLDEPFNALDKEGKKIIENLIINHCAKGGITIFTTHQKMEIDGYPLQSIHLRNNNV